MLFDLQGKRRRVVQATYLLLAVLLGGGLLFFGIGGDVQGGLFDAFSERSGNTGSNVVNDRIESNEEKVKSDPQNATAFKALTQDYYQKAASLPVGEDGKVPESGQDDLRKADENYQAYLKLTADKPDASLAQVALQLYDPLALNKPMELQEAARLRAEEENDVQSYLQLVEAATLAGNTRGADLAGVKVVDLAPKAQKKEAKQAVEKTKTDAQAFLAQSAGGAAGGGAGAPGAPGAPGVTPAPAPAPTPQPQP